MNSSQDYNDVPSPLVQTSASANISRHRNFIGPSFTNSAFAFTRRTCIAASKTILKEALTAPDEAAPILWIEQAFAVAAGIILSLDSFYRLPSEKEYAEHQTLVVEVVEYLKSFEHNKIASRGVRLLDFLQQELDRSGPLNPGKRSRSDGSNHWQSPKKRRGSHVQRIIREVSENLGMSPGATRSTASDATGSPVRNGWEALLDLFPAQTGFDGHALFDGFFPTQS